MIVKLLKKIKIAFLLLVVSFCVGFFFRPWVAYGAVTLHEFTTYSTGNLNGQDGWTSDSAQIYSNYGNKVISTDYGEYFYKSMNIISGEVFSFDIVYRSDLSTGKAFLVRLCNDSTCVGEGHAGFVISIYDTGGDDFGLKNSHSDGTYDLIGIDIPNTSTTTIYAKFYEGHLGLNYDCGYDCSFTMLEPFYYGDTVDDIDRVQFETQDNTATEDMYIDRIQTEGSAMFLSEHQFTWQSPTEDEVLSNDEYNDWNFVLDMYPTTGYDYLFARISYYDQFGGAYIDYDSLPWSNDSFLWAINRSNELPDSNINVNAEIWATASTSCANYSELDCDWSIMLVADEMHFISSSTGGTMFDYGVTGFFPPTSTLDSVYGSSTVESGFLANLYDLGKSEIYTLFPFNLFANVYSQYLLAIQSSTTPSFYQDFDLVDSQGNMSIALPENFFGTTTSFQVLGTAVLSADSTMTVLYGKIKSLSTYLLYLIFLLSLYWRGFVVYKLLLNK